MRWVPPENLHLTLKFLGDTPEDRITALDAGIREVTSQLAAFSVSLSNVGCFPNARKPRVVWTGIQAKHQHLVGLNEAIETMAQAHGFDAEEKPFRPHLTIGRVKGHIRDGATLSKLGQAIETATIGTIAEWVCTTVSLMASELAPSGSIYTCLYQYQLG